MQQRITKALCTDAVSRHLRTRPGELLCLEDPDSLLRLEQMVDLGDARLHPVNQDLGGYTHYLFTALGDTFMVTVEEVKEQQ